jgi:hypothetical protein
MNKRIQELITQAGGHWNHGDFNMPSSVEFQEQDIAKFAELIVKECGVVLSPMLRDMISRGQAYDLIKDHFGVEE